MKRFVDLTGNRYFRLKVLSFYGKWKHGASKWLCECDCGRYGAFLGTLLKGGHTKSCGCLRKYNMSELFSTHKKSRLKEYKIWKEIRQRCYNENNPAYHHYGGRGIKMSKDWYLDFMAFYRDMGPRPEDMTLERIDNNGDYCKENCKWATQREQTRNRRRNIMFIFEDKRYKLIDFVDALDVDYAKTRRRFRDNWEIKDIFDFISDEEVREFIIEYKIKSYDII